MRNRFLLILTILLAAATLFRPAIRHGQAITVLAAQNPEIHSAPTIVNSVIEPGSSVGPLKIGDSRERTLQLFPRKSEDQEWEDRCGTTVDWVDTANPAHGDLAIHLKKDKVVQIESSTTRFHTADGITIFDAPEKVKGAYNDLLAYTLLTSPTPALGDRPLIFWIDKRKGIAFALAYYRAQQKRYVYKIIVFAPNKSFCPEGETMNSSKWQQIDPYSLEPPRDLAGER